VSEAGDRIRQANAARQRSADRSREAATALAASRDASPGKPGGSPRPLTLPPGREPGKAA